MKTAIKAKRAAKVGSASSNNSAACESSAYPDISAGDAAGLKDDASSALCNAMGDLGIDPEVEPLQRSFVSYAETFCSEENMSS